MQGGNDLKPINFAIVGCGFIAAKHLQAIASLPGCCLAAVHDVDFKAAESLAIKTRAIVYKSYDDLLADPGIDVVNLCTPGYLHHVMGIKAAACGKHLLVEKPLAVNLEDADALIDACDRAGVILATAHQNRYKGPVLELKKVLEQGKMGSISHGSAVLRWNRNRGYYAQKPWRGDSSQGGGVLLNQAIHNIDLLQWMLGPVKSVYGRISHLSPGILAEEVALAVLKFKSGALGHIEACSSVYPESLEEKLAVFGAQGTAVLSGRSIGQVEKWRFEGETPRPVNYEVNPLDPGGYHPLLQDLIECIKSGGCPLTGGREGRKPLEIITAIRRSSETGQPIDL